MKTVSAREANQGFSELLAQVERGQEVLITKRGTPVAKLSPVEPKSKVTLFGCLKGQVSIEGDIVEPALPAETWEAVKEWDGLVAIARKKRKHKKSSRTQRVRA